MNKIQRKFHWICLLLLAFQGGCGISQTTNRTGVPTQISDVSPTQLVTLTMTTQITETPTFIQEISVLPTSLLDTVRPSPTLNVDAKTNITS